MSDRWTESKVFQRLRHVFPAPAHLCLSGVRNGTGYARKTTRTIDGMVFSLYPSRGLWLAGVEIKVSRSDWKKELANAEKAADIQKWCDYWYIAAPTGVVPLEELPETWGLIEVQENTATIVKRAPKLESQPPDLALVCAIFRAFDGGYISRAEAAERELEARGNSDVVKTLQSAVDSLTRRIQDFQEASGVSITEWDFGDIAEAVRIVREHNGDLGEWKRLNSMSMVLAQAKRRVRDLNEFVERLEAEA